MCRENVALGSGFSDRFQALGGTFQGQGNFWGSGEVDGVGPDRAHASFASGGDSRNAMLNINGAKSGFAWYYCPTLDRTYWMGIWGN